MRNIALALLVSLPSPALADVIQSVAVTQSVDARFGVGYRQDAANPNGTARALYEGRYTTTFTYGTDSGLRFRFDLGVVVGNMDDTRRPRVPPLHQAQGGN